MAKIRRVYKLQKVLTTMDKIERGDLFCMPGVVGLKKHGIWKHGEVFLATSKGEKEPERGRGKCVIVGRQLTMVPLKRSE